MVLNYFDGSTFEDLEEAMRNIYLIVPEYNIFYDAFEYSVTQTLEEGTLEGKYTRKIKYGENDIGTYEFAFCTYDIRTDEETNQDYLVFILTPIYFSDDRIIELIEFFDGSLYEDVLEKRNIEDLSWDVKVCADSNYNTEKDELVTFDGTIRKIRDDDLVVNYYDLNYQILEEPCDEYGNPYIGTSFSKEELESATVSWEEMKEDNFMGKIVQGGVNSIGTIIEEVYTIDSVEDDTIYCIDEEHTPIFSRNLPRLLSYENGECKFCTRYFDLIYIPYSLDESL